MTDNSYITDKAWVEVTAALLKGYCELPYAKDNPYWLMYEPIDSFGLHEHVIAAHHMRCDANIVSMKEE